MIRIHSLVIMYEAACVFQFHTVCKFVLTTLRVCRYLSYWSRDWLPWLWLWLWRRRRTRLWRWRWWMPRPFGRSWRTRSSHPAYETHSPIWTRSASPPRGVMQSASKREKASALPPIPQRCCSCLPGLVLPAALTCSSRASLSSQRMGPRACRPWRAPTFSHPRKQVNCITNSGNVCWHCLWIPGGDSSRIYVLASHNGKLVRESLPTVHKT